MPASDFDTLAYPKKLREAGFTDQQAEAQVQPLRAVIDSNLAPSLRAECADLNRNAGGGWMRSDRGHGPNRDG